MKVLFVQNIAAIAGSENYFIAILPELIKKGVSVSFLNVYLKRNRNIAKEYSGILQSLGIRVFELEIRSYFTIRPVLKIRRLIIEEKFEIVHSHLIYSDFWVSILKVTGHTGFKAVSTLHGYQEDLYVKHCLNPESLPKTTYYFLAKFCVWQLDSIYSCSFGLRKFYAGAGLDSRNKIKVIQHGFDYVDKDYNTNRYRKAPIQLCIVGRLIERKGHKFVLQILNSIRKKFPETKLVIAGGGDYEEYLKKIVQQNELGETVEFLGYNSDPISIMADSDIVLVPSFAEGLPLVIFEAFKSGTPVVAFNTVGPSEMIDNGKDGVLITPFNTTEMEEQVCALLKDEKRRSVLAQNAIVKLETKFSLVRMVDETYFFYLGLLNG